MSTSFKDRKPPTDAEIRDYFLILKEDPRSRVFAPLAEGLIRRGRLEEAAKLCTYGLNHNPQFSDGHLAYARVLFYLFRYKEALEEVKITLGFDSVCTEAYIIAAEIFLARSQHKAASDACLKALDIDPEHAEAMRLLQRLGEQSPNEGQPAAQNTSTNRFKATAGTAPSRRRIEPGETPSMTNPFQQLMQELENEGAQKIEAEEQPFTALSSGSQAGQGDLAEDLRPGDEFDVTTQPSEAARLRVPSLPARPPVEQVREDAGGAAPANGANSGGANPEDLLSQVPMVNQPSSPAQPAVQAQPSPVPSAPVPPSSPAPGPGRVPASGSAPPVTDSRLAARVNSAQAIIDSYRDRIDPEDEDDAVLRVPRYGSILSLLGILAVLISIVALILYLVPGRTKTAPKPEDEPSTGSISAPDLLPDPPPQGAPAQADGSEELAQSPSVGEQSEASGPAGEDPETVAPKIAAKADLAQQAETKPSPKVKKKKSSRSRKKRKALRKRSAKRRKRR